MGAVSSIDQANRTLTGKGCAMYRRNRSRAVLVALLVVVATLTAASPGAAQVPGPLPLDPPLIYLEDYGGGRIRYTEDGVLEVRTSASGISYFGPPDRVPLQFGELGISVRVNESGELLSTAGLPAGNEGVGLVGNLLLVEGTPLSFRFWYYDVALLVFEFRFRVTASTLASMTQDFVVQLAVHPAPETSVPDFDGTFTHDFDGRVLGRAGFTPASCDGQIGDFVWHDLNRDGLQSADEPGIGGIAVNLTGGPGSVALSTNTDTNGNYLFRDLCPGGYSIAVTPLDYAATTEALVVVNAALGYRELRADFGLYMPPPPPSTPFLTLTQGGWGSKPSANNPGGLLADHFTTVYGTAGVVIGDSVAPGVPGSGRWIKLTSASAIEAFLPQGGKPVSLTSSAVDPTGRISVLVGQLLALQLNVDFSARGITRLGLGNQVLVSGPLAGWTVNMVLDAGNLALGGSSDALPLSELTDVMMRINQNYDGATVDNGYLRAP